MAYINLAGGLKINTADAVDARLVLSKNEMLTMHYDDTRPAVLAGKIFQLPDHYLCVCSDDGKVYLYDSANEESEETGKFTLFDPQGVALVKVTYSELVALRNNSELIPGVYYLITDYVTTTTSANTRSAGNLFNVIVRADDENHLNENCSFAHSDRDINGYFAESRLEAWRGKYCLDNDTNRFAWADTENGKGIIYRMIDEFNNDVPYDFKNIQFKRKITDGEFDLDSGIDTWVYTFTGFSYENNTLVDGTTLKASEYFNDEGSNLYKNNVIGIYEVHRFQEDGFDNILETLSDNVFIGRYDEVPYVEDGPAKLVLFSFNNNLGRDCYSNTFGNNCSSNTFGNGCWNNTFGAYCHYNTFGDSCYNNTFGYACYYNTFGNNCSDNTFGDDCSDNTFGNSCQSNTFGNNCRNNTFGNNCYSNTFGNNCSSNTFGNGCYYLQISDTSTTIKRYISVDNGTQGASAANKFDLYDLAMANKDYQVTFKKSASGKYLMLWTTDTGTMTGKVKATSTTPAWSDIE